MALPDHVLHELDIKSLIVRERYYRDSAHWEKLRRSYHPDASKTQLNISWFNGNIDGFVDGSRRMVASKTISSHTIQPAEIEINGNRALAASTGSVSVRAVVDGVEYEIISLVRFHSRLCRCKIASAWEWRFLTFEAVYDRDYILRTDGSNEPAAAIRTAPGARPSYKYLDWLLCKRGFAIARDLPGLDDDASVRKMMGAAQDWLWEGFQCSVNTESAFC